MAIISVPVNRRLDPKTPSTSAETQLFVERRDLKLPCPITQDVGGLRNNRLHRPCLTYYVPTYSTKNNTLVDMAPATCLPSTYEQSLVLLVRDTVLENRITGY